MWLVDTILGNTSYGIVPTSQKVLLFDTNLRGSLLRIFRIEILCVIKKETYKRRSLSPPSFFLLWKWYCEDMIHGTEAGLLRPQGKKHKGKLQNHRKKWKAPHPKKTNWVPEVIVELPLKPLDLFLLIMNILWFKPLLLWFPSAYNSAWHIEEVQSICWFLKFKSYSFLCSKHLTQFFIYISWWVLSRLTNVQSSK